MGKTIELMLPPTSHAKFAKDGELRDWLLRSRGGRGMGGRADGGLVNRFFRRSVFSIIWPL